MVQSRAVCSFGVSPIASQKKIAHLQGRHHQASKHTIPNQSHRINTWNASARTSSHIAHAGKIQEISEEELEVEVANRDRPLIIDFFATWCGPCVLLAKELEQVADELGDAIKIIKIDCDKNEGISSALQIQGLPTLIFVGMDPNKPALRTEGLLPAQAIIEIVQKDLLGEVSE